LWTQENGDDAFDEINRVAPGFNGGWIQTIGPISRVAEFKSIETTYAAGNLQQLRWPPSNIADTPQQALSRMFMLPGAQYVDPEFSWKYALAPSPIGFVKGGGLGPQFEGDLFVGASRTTLLNGFLFRFKLTSDRQHFSFSDPRLADRVADNLDKFDLTESESLVVGKDFGITTDIQTGPNGNVFVVSLSNGAVYEIRSKPLIVLEENTGRAAALDSPSFLRDPFRLENPFNFSADQHTRIMIFAIGIDPSAVTVQLEDSHNHVHPLVVEDIRKVPNFDWLSQIVVKLPDAIDADGDFHISLISRGITSNKPLIRISNH
jgi:hypothetical protein